MKPYHAANFKLQPYPHWRVRVLAWCGWALGIQFHLQGVPFGAAYRPDLHAKHDGDWTPETSARPIRVDREGQAYLPERRVVLKAKGA